MPHRLLLPCAALLAFFLLRLPAVGQPVMTPRGIAVGALGAMATDIRGLTASPAALPGMRDWDLELVTSLPRTGGGFIFDGAAIGKRFFDIHAFGVQYMPGMELSFVMPATARIKGVDFAIDRKVTFAEPFALGYGIKVLPVLSVGVTGRVRTLTVSDPALQLVDTTITPSANDTRRQDWFLDAGLRWQALERLLVTLGCEGIPLTAADPLPAGFQAYELRREVLGTLGMQWRPVPPLGIGLQATSSGSGTFGMEWAVLPWLTARGGWYFDRDQKPASVAFSGGVGVLVGPVEFEASYLRFTKQDARNGAIAVPDLGTSVIRSLIMSPYSPDRASFGIKLALGNVADPSIQIVGTVIESEIYPSSAQTLAYQAFGRVRVRNVGAKPSAVSASFFLDRLMDDPTQSAPVQMAPGDEVDLPLVAVFNDALQRVGAMSVRDATITVRTAEGETQQAQARVVVRGRNDWDGTCRSLRHFVTTEHPEVLRWSRDILVQARDSLQRAGGGLETFAKARAIVNAFAGKLLYVQDPALSADYVQYPAETLRLNSGDCDDFSVLFSSLLGSVGIRTAFVDVVPPGHPERAHVYLLFDTGVPAASAQQVSRNPKRITVRRNAEGVETVWVPVETTLTGRGFDAAWTAGAEQWYEETELHLGLAKGWVHVIDVE